MYDLHGVSAQDAVGHSGFEFVHPEDQPRVIEELQYRAVTPGAHDRQLVYRARHADGRWRHLEMRSTNLLDDPEVGALVVSLRDATITARAVRTAAGVAKAMAAHAANAKPGEVIRMLADVGTSYVQEDHPGARVEATFDVCEAIRAGRNPGARSRVALDPRNAFRIVGAPPEEADWRLIDVLLPMAETVLSHAADRDIVTEDAAEYAALVFRTSPIATVTMDLDGRYTSVNAAMEAITGLAAEQLVGRRWEDLVHPEAPTPPDPPMVGHRKDVVSTRIISRWLIPETRRDVWLEVVSTAIVNNAGHLVQHLVQYFDLDDATRAAELMKSASHARNSEESDAERQRLSELLDDLADEHEAQKRQWAERISEDAVQRLVGTRFALRDHDLDPARAGELLDSVITQLRDTASQMRPATLGLFGIEPTLRQAVTALSAAGVETLISIPDLPRFSDVEESLLYRAALWGVTAAARPGVGRAAVDITYVDETIHIHVRDDGPTPTAQAFDTTDARALREQYHRRGWDLYIGPRTAGPGVRIEVTAHVTPRGEDDEDPLTPA